MIVAPEPQKPLAMPSSNVKGFRRARARASATLVCKPLVSARVLAGPAMALYCAHADALH